MKVIVSRSRSQEQKDCLYILFVCGLPSFYLIDMMSLRLAICVDDSELHCMTGLILSPRCHDFPLVAKLSLNSPVIDSLLLGET